VEENEEKSRSENLLVSLPQSSSESMPIARRLVKNCTVTVSFSIGKQNEELVQKLSLSRLMERSITSLALLH
jgi:hypothetical protein